ncbi:MAG TPA: helix-turn-helix domain-containing protein [Sphingobium sp.]|uniref:TetR/AcrR family transcriptional regulator n=1 Tax=Sphingobium sp. TaxID=1912891 RepID=UPI002ED02F20
MGDLTITLRATKLRGERKLNSLPSSSSKDMRAVRSRAALQEAMLRLLEKKAVDQITIRDICAESGVHKSTFFRHHATKDSLLDDIATDQIRRLNELTMAIRDASDHQKALAKLCTYVDEHRSLLSTLLNGGAAPAMRAEWVRYSMQVAAREPPGKSWLPVELGTVYAATLIAETIAWWVALPQGAHSIDEVSAILLRTLNCFMTAP